MENSSLSPPAPEKKLTLFALRLALLEKAATRLGALAFIWATVVLLGGFAIALPNRDFWLITIILLLQSARIFSRSHELEFQHQTFSSPRAWQSNNVPFLPHFLFLSKNLSLLLFWLQLLSAMACASLSLESLSRHDYSDRRNRNAALFLFYSTALAESLLFLAEKGYSAWKITFCKILIRVSGECGFGEEGEVYVRRFFYDSYSMCVNGSVFDGIKMDIVSFAEDLLCSRYDNEQLMGARIIHTFLNNGRYSRQVVKKMGRSERLVKRLVEMLRWKEVRILAGRIISKLAGEKEDYLNICMVSGAVECIGSLLYCGEFEGDLLGLEILCKVAREEDNCRRIGESNGLLGRIMGFTGDRRRIIGLRYSLGLVNRLARIAGFRREILDNIAVIGNIREILRSEELGELRKMGIEILRGLAMEGEGRERIGGTGGVMRILVSLFLDGGIEAGEAVEMLTVDSGGNCRRIMEMGFVDRLVNAMEEPLLKVVSARIVRNLWVYGGDGLRGWFSGFFSGSISKVLNGVMQEEDELLEISIGLTSQIFRFNTLQELERGFQDAGVTEKKLAERLVSMLERYNCPSQKVPRIRRFSIELAISMMKYNPDNIILFKRYGMKDHLHHVVETSSEQENFRVFNNNIGISKEADTIVSLAEKAMELLH